MTKLSYEKFKAFKKSKIQKMYCRYIMSLICFAYLTVIMLCIRDTISISLLLLLFFGELFFAAYSTISIRLCKIEEKLNGVQKWK